MVKIHESLSQIPDNPLSLFPGHRISCKQNSNMPKGTKRYSTIYTHEERNTNQNSSHTASQLPSQSAILHEFIDQINVISYFGRHPHKRTMFGCERFFIISNSECIACKTETIATLRSIWEYYFLSQKFVENLNIHTHSNMQECQFLAGCCEHIIPSADFQA